MWITDIYINYQRNVTFSDNYLFISCSFPLDTNTLTGSWQYTPKHSVKRRRSYYEFPFPHFLIDVPVRIWSNFVCGWYRLPRDINSTSSLSRPRLLSVKKKEWTNEPTYLGFGRKYANSYYDLKDFHGKNLKNYLQKRRKLVLCFLDHKMWAGTRDFISEKIIYLMFKGNALRKWRVLLWNIYIKYMYW